MQDHDVQQDFDRLVTVAEEWLTAPAFSPDERALEAALEVAWNKLAGDLEWNRS